MTLASLFDGAGTAPYAGKLVGITPLWSSEIEKYPLAVTAARLPDVVQMGDITKIDGGKAPSVDIIVGGSPCQDLSVAGSQKGLAEGTRSNLFYEMIRIIKEMRAATNGEKPKYVVWENVPGAFSSQKGYDFYEVIKEYCRVADPTVDVPRPSIKQGDRLAWDHAGTVVGNGWSLAWRVFDSQFWGVPQRRKRVYLILDLGDECAAEILFERKGVRGDSAQEQESRQAAAGDTGKSTAEADIRADSYGCDIRNLSVNKEMVGTLASKQNGGYSLNFTPPILQTKVFDGRGFGEGDVVNCITGDHESRISDYTGLVCEPVIPIEGNGSRPYHRGDGFKQEDVSYTLNSVEQHDVAYAVRVRCGYEGGGKGALIQTDVSGTLGTHNDQAVFTESSFGAYREGLGTLRESGGDCGGGSENIVIEKHAVPDDIDYSVRRLTPTECARLQGFPDWWEDGVRTSDGASYRMWGNGMTLPVVKWILGRIKEAGV